jgi:hypothetical protein
MKWITRKNVMVDRVACPWLIQRFLDPDAQFLFVEEKNLLDSATAEVATPFDAPRLSQIRLNHRGNRCTFEALLEDYNLSYFPLAQLGLIVRAADVTGQEGVAAEGAGLRALAEGFAALGLSDEQRLVKQFPIYDALYEYCRTHKRRYPISISWYGLA